jgi:hypothetical protein
VSYVKIRATVTTSLEVGSHRIALRAPGSVFKTKDKYEPSHTETLVLTYLAVKEPLCIIKSHSMKAHDGVENNKLCNSE